MLALLLAAAIADPFVTTDHTFKSGNVKLSARLYAPIGASHFPVIVTVQGSGDEKATTSASTKVHAAAFAKVGIGLLAYDKRGTGASGGALTGSDFRTLGADAAAAANFARTIKGVDAVGFWGISQAGWIVPYALKTASGARFAILVSPAGVNPFEQVEYFMERQVRSWGLSAADAIKADTMHRATSLYYAGRLDYASAQKYADTYKGEPWFRKVVSHPYWHTTHDGMLLTSKELADAVAKNPGEYELVRARSSFEDYGPLYASISVPVLLVYGSADELIPVAQSREVFRKSLRGYEEKLIAGADHNMQSGDTIRKDYLDFIVGWAKSRMDAPPYSAPRGR